MIGSRGYRIAEPPRTSSGRARSLSSSAYFRHLRTVPLLRARAPPRLAPPRLGGNG
jgi:hypothetical protein